MQCCTCASGCSRCTTNLRNDEVSTMRRHWFLRGLKFLLFGMLFVAIAGLVVMRLWNWLTPTLFGWHVITFWQAVGILILSKLLLGGFRGRPGWHPYSRRRR